MNYTEPDFLLFGVRMVDNTLKLTLYTDQVLSKSKFSVEELVDLLNTRFNMQYIDMICRDPATVDYSTGYLHEGMMDNDELSIYEHDTEDFLKDIILGDVDDFYDKRILNISDNTYETYFGGENDDHKGSSGLMPVAVTSEYDVDEIIKNVRDYLSCGFFQ